MGFELERDGDVFVLTLDQGDNRFNPTSLARLHELLDEVEGTSGPAALVTTGTGKFYSNGLDLEWVSQPDAEMNLGQIALESQKLMARLLVFPRPTVAAINGHCYAAGAMVSLCHDVRVMRSDRGFWCLPEADLNIPFTEGMGALIQARLSPQAAHVTMLTSQRYGGLDARDLGIVDFIADEATLLPTAMELASSLASKDPATVGAIKHGMYGDVASKLIPG